MKVISCQWYLKQKQRDFFIVGHLQYLVVVVQHILHKVYPNMTAEQVHLHDYYLV